VLIINLDSLSGDEVNYAELSALPKDLIDNLKTSLDRVVSTHMRTPLRSARVPISSRSRYFCVNLSYV
jgi:hypothetical protein